jgi:hypothetical protein
VKPAACSICAVQVPAAGITLVAIARTDGSRYSRIHRRPIPLQHLSCEPFSFDLPYGWKGGAETVRLALNCNDRSFQDDRSARRGGAFTD